MVRTRKVEVQSMRQTTPDVNGVCHTITLGEKIRNNARNVANVTRSDQFSPETVWVPVATSISG